MELSSPNFVNEVRIIRRKFFGNTHKTGTLRNLEVRVGYDKSFDSDYGMITRNHVCGRSDDSAENGEDVHLRCKVMENFQAIAGRFVTVQKQPNQKETLTIGEIFVFSNGGKFS